MLKECLWAESEPYKSLAAHMVDIAICVQEYVSAPSSWAIMSFLCQEWDTDKKKVMEQVGYFVAMHDMGKAHPDFQCKDE